MESLPGSQLGIHPIGVARKTMALGMWLFCLIKLSAHYLRSFTDVKTPSSGYRALGIAVPSKLAHRGDNLSPLVGMRVAVKDNFRLRDITTSLCSRTFQQVYPSPPASNAEIIQALLRAGAHVIGKTHMTSFAMLEHPTQCVDYQASFNPRGDGYLIPGGSSSGGASAVASYDWVDVALVTDSKLLHLPSYTEASLTIPSEW